MPSISFHVEITAWFNIRKKKNTKKQQNKNKFTTKIYKEFVIVRRKQNVSCIRSIRESTQMA